jgi:UDPglucose 6-dehydrogenase
LIKSVIKSNDNRSLLLLRRVSEILKNKVRNKKICFLGVTFKANTDDMRDSSSTLMIPALVRKGAKIKYYDPTGKKELFNKIKNVSFASSIKSAMFDADLIVIHTEWTDFKSLNFKSLIKKKNFIVYDMRNIYLPSKMKKVNIKYFGVGR